MLESRTQHTLPGSTPQENVEQMTFELPQPQPIKGFPELRWAGKKPFTSTHYFPAQLKEQYGDPVNGWMNRIYWGDNLQVMSHLLKEFRGKVDLVYIDPPFDSKADYKKIISLHGDSVSSNSSTFEEKQYSDIWSNDDFLQFLYVRLILIRELLSDSGSIFLHCDWHQSHRIRCIFDEVFGQKNFGNEIIRIKSNPKNSKQEMFGNIHDKIIFYKKNKKKSIWNILREEKNSEDMNRLYEYTSEDGRRYTTLALHAPGERSGETGQPWKGIHPPHGRHWAYVHS